MLSNFIVVIFLFYCHIAPNKNIHFYFVFYTLAVYYGNMASIYELCLPCVQIAMKYLPIYIQGDDKLEYRILASSLMRFRIYL